MNIPQNILNSINFKSGVYTSLAKDYIIFVDTSFWMEAETEDFLLKVLAPLLLEENKQRLTLYLLPGNYKVIFRSKSAKQYMYTTEKDFKVRSGKSELIKLY